MNKKEQLKGTILRTQHTHVHDKMLKKNRV